GAAGTGASAGAGGVSLDVEPLAVQQARAYPETATGLFASLADFEDAPGGARGFAQIRAFRIEPPGKGGSLKFVVNITRTGVGALEVTLPVGARLVFDVPSIHDFSDYKLLSLALFSRTLRDDLRVGLVSGTGRWLSARRLVRPGWNNVLVDIRRLGEAGTFDPTDVRSISIGFPDAAGAVWFNLDDIMVVDNARTIRPAPPGVVLRKSGLDYSLELPGRAKPLYLRRGGDGLWRLKGLEATVRLAGPSQSPAAAGEHIELMGSRRIGQVELLEHNALRIRLANTWYFPRRAGQWASLAVPRIRWEHTIYADGRCVTQGLLNNAGGSEIARAVLELPVPAAWAGGGLARSFIVRNFTAGIGRWCYLLGPPGPAGRTAEQNYLHPGRITATLAAAETRRPGDADGDGFDESHGCYFLAGRAGHCRFTLTPPPGGLWNPVFVIAGPWTGPVDVTSEGLAIRQVVRRADGSVIFALPGRIDRPTAVEVAGPMPLLPAGGAGRP
ncbi:MAG: hypothetical protein J7M21_03175, partial [Planctomycetes bacterium]|nr:hypothetical protein [Planctomycetota bacterium]